MSDETIDITPDVHFLQSIRADRADWLTLFAEGVDNSLDADATEIAIQIQSDAVSIMDNGRGILRANERAIARLGEHRPHPGTKLGRFGMGITYNAMSAADLLDVASTSSDGFMALLIDWERIISTGQWRMVKPRWSKLALTRGTGTTITLNRLRWDRPKDKTVAAVRKELAERFYPAIQQNVELRVNGIAVPLLREPLLSDFVEQTIQLPNGKGAQVRAGILVHPEASDLYGVSVSYKHRVIKSKSMFGCGTYSGTRQMFARVVLTADWGLTRFKDDLSDRDSDQLEDAVHEVLRPILEKCHNAQMELNLEEMADLINELLPPEMQTTRPPRTVVRGQKGKKAGLLRRKRSDGDESPTGPTLKEKSPRDKLLVVFEKPLCQEHGFGVFREGRPNRVALASDNPHVEMLMALRDRDIAAHWLADMALFLYQHARDTDPKQKLPFDDAPFGLRVWNSAQHQTSVRIPKAQA